MELFKIFGTLALKGMDTFSSDVKGASKEAEESANSIGSAFDRMATKVGGAITKAGTNIESLGKKLAPLSAFAGGVLTASIKGASDFQNSIAKVSTLVDTSQVSVQNLSDTFLDLSNETGKSATELAEAGYQALSAGVSVDKLGDFTRTATNLARAGFTEASTAVDVLTTAMNAYGESAGTADEIANKLVRTQNLGKTTVDELASSMGKIIPTASAMNVDINNLTSGYVSLTKQGIATAEATTYMNSMLNELGDSGTTLGGVLKDKTGKSFQDLMNEGYSLADVLQITKDYADENKIAYNELWGSAEAGKAGLAILNGGVDEFNGTLEVMKSDVDDVGEALDKLETPSVQVGRSINRMKNSGIELGQAFITALLPTINRVCDGIETLTTWFNGLDDNTKTLITSILSGLAVLSPVMIIGGKILKGVGNFITWIPKLISTLSSLWGVLMANPIALVIIAVTALVAGFIYLWNTSDEFRQFWIDLWNSITEWVTTAVSNISAFLSQSWDNIGTSINDSWTAISNFFSSIWTAISTTVTNILNAISAFLTKSWTDIRTTCSNVWNAISSFISNILNTIRNTISNIWNGIRNTITSILTAIRNFIESTWNNVKSRTDNIWNNIRNFISTVLNGIRSTFSSIFNAISSFVSSIFNGIRNNISNSINGAYSTVTSVLNSIRNAFSNILNSAYNTVSSVISRIRGLFNFSWSLPRLKLPHISISGSFSLMPPRAPSFSISWYKKAMDNPFLFTEPTMFSYDPTSNVGKVAGEAGDEVMYGRSNLMNDIGQVVNASNADVSEKLDGIIGLLNEYLPEVIEKITRQIILDSGIIVGELAPAMNTELGQLSKRGER